MSELFEQCCSEHCLNSASSPHNLIRHEPNQLTLCSDSGCHDTPVAPYHHQNREQCLHTLYRFFPRPPHMWDSCLKKLERDWYLCVYESGRRFPQLLLGPILMPLHVYACIYVWSQLPWGLRQPPLQQEAVVCWKHVLSEHVDSSLLRPATWKSPRHKSGQH